MSAATRWLRVVWPFVFFLPLSWLAGRFCSWPPMDPLYHAIVELHRRLPLIVMLVVGLSILAVLLRLAAVRARFETLLTLGGDLPARVRSAFVLEAALMAMPLPRIAYLDVEARMCCTVIGGPAVLLSRGFIEKLDDDDLALVARHELVHVRNDDPRRGLLWHLALSALPASGGQRFESWLSARRELQAHALARAGRTAAYDALVSRLGSRRLALCTQPTLVAQPASIVSTFFAPAAGIALILALFLSHIVFTRDLPFLLSHHC